MSGIRQTLAQLKALRGTFAKLQAESVGKKQDLGSGTASRLRALSPAGDNPGNLRMHVYVPANLPDHPPLVVALHGCGQTAFDYDQGTGWSQLADRHGFVVLYPEQQAANNPQRCFSWFQPGDISRDLGEARSIHEMVEQAIANFGIDRRKVSITGLSAGGAMAAVMLATYPEVYASGAIIAGLPYRCASSVQEALEAMFNDQRHSPGALGDRVRAASRYSGPWPRVSVWHGTADQTVKPSNAENLIRQWSNVHRLPVEPTRMETFGPHTRRIWEDMDGKRQIEAISVLGMGHGVPLAHKSSPDACGVPGPFFLDVGLSSTVHIAEYFGFDDGLGRRPPRADRIAGREFEHATPANSGPEGKQGARENLDGSYQAGRSDPNSVIAAELQAAGLPGSPGKSGIDPKAIIEATLKAAGIWRR